MYLEIACQRREKKGISTYVEIYFQSYIYNLRRIYFI